MKRGKFSEELSDTINVTGIVYSTFNPNYREFIATKRLHITLDADSDTQLCIHEGSEVNVKISGA
jgi:hypothetical protein